VPGALPWGFPLGTRPALRAKVPGGELRGILHRPSGVKRRARTQCHYNATKVLCSTSQPTTAVLRVEPPKHTCTSARCGLDLVYIFLKTGSHKANKNHANSAGPWPLARAPVANRFRPSEAPKRGLKGTPDRKQTTAREEKQQQRAAQRTPR
jgi:hypothetical protein